MSLAANQAGCRPRRLQPPPLQQRLLPTWQLQRLQKLLLRWGWRLQQQVAWTVSSCSSCSTILHEWLRRPPCQWQLQEQPPPLQQQQQQGMQLLLPLIGKQQEPEIAGTQQVAVLTLLQAVVVIVLLLRQQHHRTSSKMCNSHRLRLMRPAAHPSLSSKAGLCSSHSVALQHHQASLCCRHHPLLVSKARPALAAAAW